MVQLSSNLGIPDPLKPKEMNIFLWEMVVVTKKGSVVKKKLIKQTQVEWGFIQK